MNKSFKGFTLVEALITVVFFSLIVGACFLLSKVGNESWQVNSTRVEIAQENRKALDALMRELYQSGASTVAGVPADGNWHSSMSFKTAIGVENGAAKWGDQITYSMGGNNNDQLIRSQSGQDRVLANHLQTLQFRRQSTTPSVIEIALSFRKKTARATQHLDLSANTKIKMRNE